MAAVTDVVSGTGSRIRLIAPCVLLAIVQVGGSHGAGTLQLDRRPMDGLGVALALAGPVLLLGRRRLPLPVLIAVAAVTVIFLSIGYPFGPVLFSLLVAAAAVIRTGRRWTAWSVAGVAYLAVVGGLFLPGESTPTIGNLTGLAAWLLVGLLLAEGLRVRAVRAADAARVAAERQRSQVATERMTIARELHDVLAHNISLINVQASVALHLLDERPDAARDALGVIKHASKDVLVEMRTVLGVLRGIDDTTDSADPGPSTESREPVPGLGRLDDLLDRVGATGLTVQADIDPTVRTGLSAAVDLAAYRIVQEALTNAARHGDGDASISLHRDQTALLIEVRNRLGPGVVGDARGGGHGLVGMRERATTLGGSLHAGIVGDRFVVSASLPIETVGAP